MVVRSVASMWRAIVPSISQYGTKPYSSWPGTGRVVAVGAVGALGSPLAAAGPGPDGRATPAEPPSHALPPIARTRMAAPTAAAVPGRRRRAERSAGGPTIGLRR